MARYDYDLFVIGAGSGGVRASRISAGFGARVAVAEERYLGGTCVNVGCIPKKLLVYASHFRDDFEDAAGFGWSLGERSVDWPTLIANKDREIERLNGVYANLLDGAGVDRIVEVDFGANVMIDAAIIKPGGVVASYSSTRVREPVLPYYPFAFKGVTLHMLQAYIMAPEALAAMITDIADRVAAGALTHTVAERFPLAETAAAHEALESGQVIGKVVVEPNR